MREIRCANCGIVIKWRPTVVNGEFYCCIGCSQGGPCTCDYSHLPRPGETSPLAPMGKASIVRNPLAQQGTNPAPIQDLPIRNSLKEVLKDGEDHRH